MTYNVSSGTLSLYTTTTLRAKMKSCCLEIDVTYREHVLC